MKNQSKLICQLLVLILALSTQVISQTGNSDKLRQRKVVSKKPTARLITSKRYRPKRKSIELEKSTVSGRSDARFIEKEVFQLINLKRVEKGLSELKWDEKISKIARDHSEKMAIHGFFSHFGLNGNTVDERAIRLGVNDWSGIGENIAYCKGITNPSGFAVEGWMKSEGHKRNLLNSSWQKSGLGVAITEDGKYFFTQVFTKK
jgi:uncharacterized protein YkwD